MAYEFGVLPPVSAKPGCLSASSVAGRAWWQVKRLTGVAALNARLSRRRVREYADLAARCDTLGLADAAAGLRMASAVSCRR